MRTLKPATEDLDHRRPVWEALSDLFLDTDTSLSRSWRIGILAESPYSLGELQQILIDEVYPVCRWNSFGIAGEWAGFDQDWLEGQILRRLRSSPWRRLLAVNLGKLTLPLSREWRHTKAGIAILRTRAGWLTRSREGRE